MNYNQYVVAQMAEQMRNDRYQEAKSYRLLAEARKALQRNRRARRAA